MSVPRITKYNTLIQNIPLYTWDDLQMLQDRKLFKIIKIMINSK